MLHQSEKECFICGYQGEALHRHHIYAGKNRNKSEEYGMWVWLCYWHHNDGSKNCVHNNPSLDKMLKEEGQREFEKYIGSRSKFRLVFDKSYI